MLKEELYKSELASLKDYGKKNGFVPLKLIEKTFDNISDELLDDVVNYLEQKNIDVTDIVDDESLNLKDPLVEHLDEAVLQDDFDALVGEPDEVDLMLEEETDIKVSDFDSMVAPSFQTDDVMKMYLHEIGQVELLSGPQESEYASMVQTGIASKEKLDQAKKSGKKLSPDDINELNEAIEQGRQAQDILIESNLRLVVSIAKRYINRGLEISDLIQEGNLGLMKAVIKYDHLRGFKFSTYATWWIRQAITRAIADKGRNVRIPVHMVECINRLYRSKRKLLQELKREPTVDELAADMKLSPEKIVDLQRVSQDSISFDSSVGDEDDSTLIDLVADSNTLNPLEYTEKSLYSEEIDKVLQTLTPREENVIRLRYGIGYDRSHTLEEVGNIMRVTRERVRQIESKALARLRHHTRINRLREHLENA